MESVVIGLIIVIIGCAFWIRAELRELRIKLTDNEAMLKQIERSLNQVHDNIVDLERNSRSYDSSA